MKAAVIAGFALFIGLSTVQAQPKEPLEIVDMGSFHIGGRTVEVSGKPVKDVVFTPGGVPAKVDPNGPYMTEQMYVQYFVPKTKRAQLPILLWHGQRAQPAR